MTSTAYDADRKPTVDLPEELRFVLELEALKDLERQNPLATGERRERVAEHSWHLAVAAVLLADYAEEDVDLGRAALLAVVHDVVERFVGDTFAFGDNTTDQHQREHDAMRQLACTTSARGIQRLVECWREYEEQSTSTARFVKGIDAVLPIVQNYSNPEHSSWKTHGVAADKVRARLRSHGNPGALSGMAEEMISDAQDRGYLA